MVWRGKPLIGLAGAALFVLSGLAAQAETAQVDSIHDVIAKLKTCWKPPPAGRAHPGIDITVAGGIRPDWCPIADRQLARGVCGLHGSGQE